jgi:hypothetical protein
MPLRVALVSKLPKLGSQRRRSSPRPAVFPNRIHRTSSVASRGETPTATLARFPHHQARMREHDRDLGQGATIITLPRPHTGPPVQTSDGPPRLLTRVRAGLRARHYSRRTARACVGWIRRFILFHGKRSGPRKCRWCSVVRKRSTCWGACRGRSGSCAPCSTVEGCDCSRPSVCASRTSISTAAKSPSAGARARKTGEHEPAAQQGAAV